MSSLSSRQVDRLLSKIHGMRSAKQADLELLSRQIGHECAAVRYAAVSVLWRLRPTAETRQLFLERLEVETDQDVLIPLLSALSVDAQGSKDYELAARLQDAVARAGRIYSGTSASLEDALLRILEGLDSRSIAKLGSNERAGLLERITSRLPKR